MTITISFPGFPPEAPRFLKKLAANNDKLWFNEHKTVFTENVLRPAQAFVTAMGDRLTMIAPDIHADPRTDKSIFRIYRDTRFSPDKRPYKTHLGIFWWEGKHHKMSCPGFYFHLESNKLMLGAGIHLFCDKEQRNAYREAVVDKKSGAGLQNAIAEVKNNGINEVLGKHYKRVPRGFDPQHPNAEYLLYNGLYALRETAIPGELFSEALVDYCFEWYQKWLPLHRWLLEMVEGGSI